ncbi:kinetochore scaffold 1 [Morone saxatilis]|uniref:kinetochore scaffold 1 n=1 Tax=Morone saxatilis TaxID=34816 RepID=UPI0015E1CD02|nr:kinetochore scaffold 1 [Morone saxatilis]
MEPLDPFRNDEGSGFSKRRISSILKAPRKSIRFPDPEQQEHTVECPKPVEKRNSRRVSFAPANDVLLFSKDVKNASPVRSPLQDLLTTVAATQNRVQVAVTEDRIQQIAGMETLLNAPLHTSQQRDKVNFDTRDDFGERTVMFSTDDAFMDMTHCHTININNDADLLADISLQNHDVLPTSREKTVMFTADDGSMDMTLSHTVNMPNMSVLLTTSRNMDLCAEKRNTPSMRLPAGASSEETSGSLAQIKTLRADVDKENQAPTSLSAVMAKSLNTSRMIGESSNRSALYPKDDVSMDMTEALTGRIQGFTDDDDPFQCLFPTQEMYSHLDNKVSQTAEKTKRQQSSKMLASFNPKDMTSLKNTPLHDSHQRQDVNLHTKDECREKTIIFTAGDEFMDVTRSHTVNIASGSLAPPNQNCSLGKMDNASSLEERKQKICGPPGSSANGVDLGFKNFLANLYEKSAPSGNPVIARMEPPTAAASSKETVSTNSSLSQLKTDVSKENRPLNTTRSFGESFNGGAIGTENDASMDMTEAVQTVLTASDDPFQFLFPTQDMYPHRESLKKPERTSGRKSAGMETSLKPSIKTKVQRHQVNFDAEDDCREKTVRFTADDGCMDVTRSQTVNIVSHLGLQSHQNVGFLPAGGEKTVRFTASDAAMDVTQSHTVNIATDFNPQSHQNVDFLPPCGEKTIRFNANDAAMDVTRSQTVNIVSDLGLQSNPNLDFVPTCGEKTVRFSANDAAMDVTQSHTVNIATNFDPQSHQDVDFLPTFGEKTIRFTANDATMDVTRSQTVNIVSDLGLQSNPNLDFVPTCGEKTVRFSANDAAMDVTRSLTVNIATNFDLQSHQDVDFLPTCEEKTEKTVRFTAKDAAMDVTRSQTVNIVSDFELHSHRNMDFLPSCKEKTMRFMANDEAMNVTQSNTANVASNLLSDSGLPPRDSNILSAHENVDFPLSAKKRESEACRPSKNRPSSTHTLDPGFKNSLSRTSGLWAKPVITEATSLSPQETVDANGFLNPLKTQKPEADTAKQAPGFVSASMENSVNQTMADYAEDDVSMDMTAQTGHILRQTSIDEPLQCPDSDHLNKTEGTSQQGNVVLGSSSPECVKITNRPNLLDSNETDNRKEPKPRNQACSPSAVNNDVDTAPSRKSRRMSLADLHSKVRRLSHMINTAPDANALDSCTTPLPQLEHDMDKNSKDRTKSLPVVEAELEMGLVNTEENIHAQCLMEGEEPSPTTTTTTSFNLKTKQLMSRLSVGGFKAKLPQRSKPDDPKKVNSVGEHTRTLTVNVTNQLTNFDNDVSDIYDEELGSCEDMSEMLDTRSPQKATGKVNPSQEFNVDGPLEDDVFEQDFISPVHVKKRPLPVDENNTEDEKRIKASTETATDFEMGLQSDLVECDSNITTAPCMTTQTTDYCNSSHTASIRCEATFESSFKHSLFESQLEDYACDMQKKLNDGTITVLEFFKLFNIDFVIHNPRQSVLPGRLLSDTECTPMDLLKDRLINRPKQAVYETDVLNLTEKVEGLKERMRDLDKPLKTVNRPLWEEMKNSSEKELKSFGAKLKERNNLFRKMSKVQSHEMKEVLYSNLVQANLEEQQRLRGTIEEADEMIKSLDDCIGELETELAAVEEKGFENTPSLKSRQEEMQKVTEALADNDRQITELEMQKKQNSNKLNRLKAETRNLESHITALQMVNEWKLGEKSDNCTAYTFLHETFHLQLVFEKNGNDAGNQSERKISHITFKQQFDDEKSQGHACLVHKLLSQYIEGEAAWVEKYPTSRHVPKLLHDVGLVVSRCRLLGEELRLLKMWGGLRLNILNISCVDTQVHIVFSSLKKFSKFEVIFSVSVTNHLCVLKVQSFRNLIGTTTIQQIEEIVASFSPAKKLLTKIVRKIHENLLC